MSSESERFERMVRQHHDAVLAYAMRRVAPDDAKDVVADTFLVAWRRFADAPDDHGLPWLYAIARRTLANHRRGARRREALTERLSASTPVVCEGDQPLRQALAMLSDRDREALLLVAWEGLTAQEACRVMGCRPATFRMRLHRARGRLAAHLNEPRPAPSSSPSVEHPT